jgi:hypothetical protein
LNVNKVYYSTFIPRRRGSSGNPEKYVLRNDTLSLMEGGLFVLVDGGSSKIFFKSLSLKEGNYITYLTKLQVNCIVDELFIS